MVEDDRHLNENELHVLAEAALGVSPAGKETHLDARCTQHLSVCQACQEELSELSAVLSGNLEWKPESTKGYDVVNFQTAQIPTLSFDVAPEEQLPNKLAAKSSQSSVQMPRARLRLTSVDGSVTASVFDWPDDDTCRLYVSETRPEIDPSAMRLYVPPGVVHEWPERDYLSFPRFAVHAIDWVQLKLLRPQR